MNAQEANDTGDKARELQRALYRAAKASSSRRFHALYDKVYREDILRRAWGELKANAGAAGTDGQTIEGIEQEGVEGFRRSLPPGRLPRARAGSLSLGERGSAESWFVLSRGDR